MRRFSHEPRRGKTSDFEHGGKKPDPKTDSERLRVIFDRHKQAESLAKKWKPEIEAQTKKPLTDRQLTALTALISSKLNINKREIISEFTQRLGKN